MNMCSAVLAGVTDPAAIRRGVCCAGHKALYCDEWGGFRTRNSLRRSTPHWLCCAIGSSRALRRHRRSLERSATEWAARLGLPGGIPIAIGEMDVHYGAIGCGIEEGILVKVIGTSTCDAGWSMRPNESGGHPGDLRHSERSHSSRLSGVEAGQSAVGDIFKWWVEGVCEGEAELHAGLTQRGIQSAARMSGLLALDWNNGNRTILVDPADRVAGRPDAAYDPGADLSGADRGHGLWRASDHRAS